MDRPLAQPALSDVDIDDSFWNPRIDASNRSIVDHQYDHLDSQGLLENFEIAADNPDGEYLDRLFQDASVYKWVEAASYALATNPQTGLRQQVDTVVQTISDAQLDDGYLNTYFQLVTLDNRWTLHYMGELYDAGHLFEAAVAHHRATGSDRLLDVAVAFADHITARFGPEKERWYPGHPEIGIGLTKLYRVTGNDRYLQLVKFFLDERGKSPPLSKVELDRLTEWSERDGPEKIQAEYPLTGWSTKYDNLLSVYRKRFCSPKERNGRKHYRPGERFDRPAYADEESIFDGTYSQDHAPVRELREAHGHAVRATYLYAAMTDLAMALDDDTLRSPVHDIWENMTEKRMYLTGGIGSIEYNERLTEDYHLPNRTGFAETCAAIGSVFWNDRLHRMTGESRFIDVLERALYNGVLSGMSLDGEEFFYENPLASDGDHHREAWFPCPCCPPNLARLLASLGQYIYSTSTEPDGIYVNLFVGSDASFSIDETEVSLTQQTELPWNGNATIEITTARPSPFELNVRIPDWARNPTVTVNGDDIGRGPENGYVGIDREWTQDDRVDVSFDMPVHRISSHPHVRNNTGRVALQRGPLVYCFEGADNPAPLSHLALTDDPLTERFDRELLDGVLTLEGQANRTNPTQWDGQLYKRVQDIQQEPTDITAIPYYAWDNREPGEMVTWIQSSAAEGE